MAKNQTLRLSLLCGAAFFLPLANVAVAAPGGRVSDDVASTASGGVAPAQASASTDAGSGDIVVTARRRSEKLENVPVSVTALNAEELSSANIQSFSSLQRLVPSMTLYSPSRDRLFVSIRGQGGYSPGSGPGVVTYLNEVPLPAGANNSTGGGGPGLFYDLESVQVLKGPQGTLFGRNTTGGAILFSTKRPTNEFGGYVQATVGSRSDREIEGAINVPLIDDVLALRAAGTVAAQDGYTKITGKGANAALDEKNFVAGRISLLFSPNSNVSSLFVYDRVRNHNNGASSLLSYVDPNGFAAFLFPEVSTDLSAQQALGTRRQGSVDAPLFSRIDFTSLTNVTSISLTDDTTFRLITSYGRQKDASSSDIDGSSAPVLAITTVRPYISEQYSIEPQIQGGKSGGLNWVVGAFYLKSPKPNFEVLENTVFGGKTYEATRAQEESSALYAQATVPLPAISDKLSFTAGLRYTWDDRYTEFRDGLPDGSCAPTGGTACSLINRANFQAPTWTLGLDYKATDDLLLYVASRRGYRTGGFNVQAQLPANRSFSPEYVTDIEFGAKWRGDIGGTPAQANAAIYAQRYSDIQISIPIQETPGGALVDLVRNVARGRLLGGEFDGWVEPIDGVRLGGQFSWTDLEYTSAGGGISLADLKSSFRPPNIPKFKYGFSVDYTRDLPADAGRLDVGLNWSWQDKAYIIVIPDPLDTQRQYGLLSGHIDLGNPAGLPISFSLFGTNLTKERYAVGGYQLSNVIGTSTLAYGEPRTFGLRMRADF